MNTETMNMKEINDVHAIVEIGEDNTTALIVDPRTPIRTTFEQRNTAEQAKLATMIWNIGVESILNAASQSMLLCFKIRERQSPLRLSRLCVQD